MLSARNVRSLFLIAILGLFLAPSRARAQSFPPAFSATATYAVGDQVQYAGNIYRAIKAGSSPILPAVNYHSWELSQVLSNTTIMIGNGQFFPDLATAWTYALYARVADGAYLHFYISTAGGNFSETFTAPFLLDHGSGPRVAILGDNSANISLNFSGGNGLIIDTGHSLNTLSGFTLNSTSSNPITAIKADGNATITAIAGIDFTNFGTDLQALQASSLSVQTSCTYGAFTNYVADAELGGSISFSGPLNVMGIGTQGNQVALYATSNGQIVAENGNINVFEKGCFATYGGYIDVKGSNLSENVTGVETFYGGTVNVEGGTVDECAAGIIANYRSLVDCSLATVLQNTVDISSYSGSAVEATNAAFSTTEVGGNGAYINH
jgi:hypothetical protein